MAWRVFHILLFPTEVNCAKYIIGPMLKVRYKYISSKIVSSKIWNIFLRMLRWSFTKVGKVIPAVLKVIVKIFLLLFLIHVIKILFIFTLFYFLNIIYLSPYLLSLVTFLILQQYNVQRIISENNYNEKAFCICIDFS